VVVETARVAYVFPGQGSQWAGMGRDLYDNFDSSREVFEEADEALGFPLSRLCFDGPGDELRQTINAQPAVVTVSYACLKAMLSSAAGNGGFPPPAFVAGHSLGEYTALAAAGVLDFTTTVSLARERGRLMHEAGQIKPGGMVAIIGLDEEALAEVCAETGTWIANINCPGQIVISGAREDLPRASELAKARGARRTIPLEVSGAFHTPLMEPAVKGMAEIIATLSFHEPLVPIVGNTTARPLSTAELIKEELLAQLDSCVQWQRSVAYITANGVDTFVEIGPGKVLTGLIRRIDRGVRLINIEDTEAIKESG